ncbi:MAG: type II secretion system protein GspD, partial [Myxococcales bacterium]
LAQLGGFLAGLQGPLLESFPIPAFSIVMQALQKSSDVNVLSTPHILTSDNEEAEITVGQNVPFQAGVTSSLLGSGLGSTAGAAGLNTAALGGLLGGYGGLIAPIQRTNVELKLKIKPQINESDYIRLQIEEQTEEIAERDPQLGPTTAKRSAKTTIVARDQQTVVIGGLIQERTVKSVEKTPLLGDIPIVGRLFRSTSTEKMKTNLLLFLTPYIVRDQADFRRIFERKLKERQEFVEQFYGRQPGYSVPIDYARKAGPLATMFKAQDEARRKAENGGPGAPDERLILPSSRPTRGDGEGPAPAPVEAPPPPEVHEPPAAAE